MDEILKKRKNGFNKLCNLIDKQIMDSLFVSYNDLDYTQYFNHICVCGKNISEYSKGSSLVHIRICLNEFVKKKELIHLEKYQEKMFEKARLDYELEVSH